MTALQTPLGGVWCPGPRGSERQRVAKLGLPPWHHFGYPISPTFWRAKDTEQVSVPAGPQVAGGCLERRVRGLEGGRQVG